MNPELRRAREARRRTARLQPPAIVPIYEVAAARPTFPRSNAQMESIDRWLGGERAIAAAMCS